MVNMGSLVNKFVRTKMRLKEETKIQLQREICKICKICRFQSNSSVRKKRATHGRTDPRTDGQTDPHIEM